MRFIRITGIVMFVYAATMLALLATPARDWALEWSIARLVSASDRRVNNSVDGSVDLPIAIAGSAVVMFAGLWFAVLVPWVMAREQGEMEALIRQAQAERAAGAQH